jgi:hypothetical protein
LRVRCALYSGETDLRAAFAAARRQIHRAPAHNTTAGLQPARGTRAAIRQFAAEDIDADNRAYRRPLEQSAKALLREIGGCEVVLLGSIASPKYVDALLQIFGTQLVFPADFVGRGDMSRGGLLLRHAAADIELSYVPVAGAVRHGPRPPKLAPPCPPSRR